LDRGNKISFLKKKLQMDHYNNLKHIIRNPNNQFKKASFIKNICDAHINSLILDVGCGVGLEFLVFHEFGFELIGIDLSYTQVKIGYKIIQKQSKNFIHFVIGDAEKLPFIQNVFDVVFCIALLHHVPDAYLVLSEMIDVAKNKGKFAMSEPNIFNFYDLLKTLTNYKVECGKLKTLPYIKSFFNKLPLSNIYKYNLIITPKLFSKRFSYILHRIGDILQNTSLNIFLSIVNIYIANIEKKQ